MAYKNLLAACPILRNTSIISSYFGFAVSYKYLKNPYSEFSALAQSYPREEREKNVEISTLGPRCCTIFESILSTIREVSPIIAQKLRGIRSANLARPSRLHHSRRNWRTWTSYRWTGFLVGENRRTTFFAIFLIRASQYLTFALFENFTFFHFCSPSLWLRWYIRCSSDP